MSVTTSPNEPTRPADAVDKPPEEAQTWREWIMVAVGLTALLAIIAAAVALVAFATNDKQTTEVIERAQPAKAATRSRAAMRERSTCVTRAPS